MAEPVFPEALTPELRAARLDPLQTARAMVANQRWADRLGWGLHAKAIATLISAPDATPDDAVFATSVAAWQAGHGQAVDGILGPQTWGAMRALLEPPDSLTGLLPPSPPVPVGLQRVFEVFGDPRPLFDASGNIDAKGLWQWERQILARGEFPFPISVRAAAETMVIRGFQAHRLLVPVFEAVFQEIDRLGLRSCIRSFDGIYNFRKIRGSTSSLSLHAFGAAIDLDAATNALGTRGDMDPRVIEVFEHFGFFWGGRFSRPDPMHFQYARSY